MWLGRQRCVDGALSTHTLCNALIYLILFDPGNTEYALLLTETVATLGFVVVVVALLCLLSCCLCGGQEHCLCCCRNRGVQQDTNPKVQAAGTEGGKVPAIQLTRVNSLLQRKSLLKEYNIDNTPYATSYSPKYYHDTVLVWTDDMTGTPKFTAVSQTLLWATRTLQWVLMMMPTNVARC